MRSMTRIGIATALLGGCILPSATLRAEDWKTEHDAGWNAYKAGRLEEAEAHLATASKEARAFEQNDPRLALTLDHLAWVLSSEGKYAEAKPLAKSALDLRRKARGAEHADVAASLNTLAGVLDAEGSAAEAAPIYAQCLALTEKLDGPDHPNVAAALDNLAAVDHLLGEREKAEALYKRALAIREKTAGAESIDLAATLHNLGVLYFDEKKFDEAEPVLNRALAIQRKALKPDHPDVAASLEALGWLHAAEGKADAEALLKQALALYEADLGKDHPHVARCCSELSRACLAHDHKDAAEAYSNRALGILETAGDPAQLATALDDHAAVLRKTGRDAEAEKLEARAQTLRESVKKTEPPKD